MHSKLAKRSCTSQHERVSGRSGKRGPSLVGADRNCRCLLLRWAWRHHALPVKYVSNAPLSTLKLPVKVAIFRSRVDLVLSAPFQPLTVGVHKSFDTLLYAWTQL